MQEFFKKKHSSCSVFFGFSCLTIVASLTDWTNYRGEIKYLLNRPILLNEPRSKVGQYCANNWHKIDRCATKCRTWVALLWRNTHPFETSSLESYLLSSFPQLKEWGSSPIEDVHISSNILECKWLQNSQTVAYIWSGRCVLLFGLVIYLSYLMELSYHKS